MAHSVCRTDRAAASSNNNRQITAHHHHIAMMLQLFNYLLAVVSVLPAFSSFSFYHNHSGKSVSFCGKQQATFRNSAAMRKTERRAPSPHRAAQSTLAETANQKQRLSSGPHQALQCCVAQSAVCALFSVAAAEGRETPVTPPKRSTPDNYFNNCTFSGNVTINVKHHDDK